MKKVINYDKLKQHKWQENKSNDQIHSFELKISY